MAYTDPTVNYGWDLPDVAADSGSWGGGLNDIIDDIDTQLGLVSDVADAALPLAGGTMTGHQSQFTQSMATAAIATGSGTKTLDLEVAQAWVQTGTLSGAVVFDIVNVVAPTGEFDAIILSTVNAGNASSVSYKLEGVGKSVKWQDGAAPTYTTDGEDIIVLFTADAWVSVYGVHAIADPS